MMMISCGTTSTQSPLAILMDHQEIPVQEEITILGTQLDINNKHHQNQYIRINMVICNTV